MSIMVASVSDEIVFRLIIPGLSFLVCWAILSAKGRKNGVSQAFIVAIGLGPLGILLALTAKSLRPDARVDGKPWKTSIRKPLWPTRLMISSAIVMALSFLLYVVLLSCIDSVVLGILLVVVLGAMIVLLGSLISYVFGVSRQMSAKRAAAGDAVCLYNQAIKVFRGEVGFWKERNVDEAISWLKRAAEKGLPEAKDALDLLVAALTR